MARSQVELLFRRALFLLPNFSLPIVAIQGHCFVEMDQ